MTVPSIIRALTDTPDGKAAFDAMRNDEVRTFAWD